MIGADEHFDRRATCYDRSSSWVSDERLLRAMVELSGAGPDSAVLDLATGTGLVARAFRGRVRSVTGVDVSREMVRRAAGGVDGLVLARTERLPFAAASFDACVCRQGLQFVDVDPTLAEVHRVLRPGGVVVLCHLTAYGEADRERAFRIQALRNPARRNFLLPDTLSRALVRHGFRDVVDRDYVSDESVGRWIENGAISAERMEEIRALYRSADDEFRRIHHVRFTEDDIRDAMLLVLTTGRK